MPRSRAAPPPCACRGRASRITRPLGRAGDRLLAADDTRTALSRLSAAFYGFPVPSMLVIGITGTNGKTSITYMLEAIMKRQRAAIPASSARSITAGAANPSPRRTPRPNRGTSRRSLPHEAGRRRRGHHGSLLPRPGAHRADDIDFDAARLHQPHPGPPGFSHDFEALFRAPRRGSSISWKEPKTGPVRHREHRRRVRQEDLPDENQYSYPVMGFGIENDADYMP